jgi:hypothetical protein
MSFQIHHFEDTSPAAFRPLSEHVPEFSYVEVDRPLLDGGLVWGRTMFRSPKPDDPTVALDLAITKREVTPADRAWAQRHQAGEPVAEIGKDEWVRRRDELLARARAKSLRELERRREARQRWLVTEGAAS